jgi:hypothetical protein
MDRKASTSDNGSDFYTIVPGSNLARIQSQQFPLSHYFQLRVIIRYHQISRRQSQLVMTSLKKLRLCIGLCLCTPVSVQYTLPVTTDFTEQNVAACKLMLIKLQVAFMLLPKNV